jgi:hypothetical protein
MRAAQVESVPFRVMIDKSKVWSSAKQIQNILNKYFT